MNNAQGIPLNCGSIIGGSVPTYTFNKPRIGGDFFQLFANPKIRTISAATSGFIYQDDLILLQSSGATTITDYETIVQQLTPETYNVSIYSNNSGVILGANDAGLSSGISSGNTSLVAIFSTEIFSSVNVSVSGLAGQSSINFNAYTSGSLGKEASDAIDNRIVGLNETAKPIFSTQNHNTPLYVRNTGCWANDLDLTPISPWNSTEANFRAGVLISPRHILFAAHYQIGNNATIRFIDDNNNIVTRTMVNKLTHPEYFPYNNTYNRPFYPDISIGVLDSDVPGSIGFVKILPQNWSNYLPSLGVNYRLPVLFTDQEEKALITELAILDIDAQFIFPTINSTRYLFSEGVITGDSGSPAFLIIDGELVIITIWTSGGAGQGTSILYHKDAINTMMSTLGGGYSLTEIDLSGFTDYS